MSVFACFSLPFATKGAGNLCERFVLGSVCARAFLAGQVQVFLFP